MAQLGVYPAAAAIDFDFQKDTPQRTVLGSDQNDVILSIPPTGDRIMAGSAPGAVGPEVNIAGLPPLLRGHSDVHLRAGVIRAFSSRETDSERAFLTADLSQVYAQHERWRANLPDIEPFFAVKSNPDPYVLRLLAGLGTGFDCASHGEISQVLEIGVDASRIVFANPCKPTSFVRAAAAAGVSMMTFDNADELHKIARVHAGAKLIVRILTDDSKSLCRLGLKFGAALTSVPGLLGTARELGLEVVGVSFHVGSGCFDANAFGDAVMRARAAFEMGRAAGYEFKLLDVGGGFEDGEFERMAGVLRGAMEVHFPNRVAEGVRVIAEPGRFYVSRAFTLAANIIARRVPERDEEEEGSGSVMYYINDGVYGSFNCTLFDHQVVQPYVVSLHGSFVSESVLGRERQEMSSVWGPTCDSIDCVSRGTLLPGTLEVGDWLGFRNMGAYTVCAASSFNGFEKSRVVYTSGVEGTAEAAGVRRALAGAAGGQ